MNWISCVVFGLFMNIMVSLQSRLEERDNYKCNWPTPLSTGADGSNGFECTLYLVQSQPRYHRQLLVWNTIQSQVSKSPSPDVVQQLGYLDLDIMLTFTTLSVFTDFSLGSFSASTSSYPEGGLHNSSSTSSQPPLASILIYFLVVGFMSLLGSWWVTCITFWCINILNNTGDKHSSPLLASCKYFIHPHIPLINCLCPLYFSDLYISDKIGSLQDEGWLEWVIRPLEVILAPLHHAPVEVDTLGVEETNSANN